LLGYKPFAKNLDTASRAEVFMLPKHPLQRGDIITLGLGPEHPPIAASANALQVTPELFPSQLGKGLT